MRDENKTKKQLINELVDLRQELTGLRASKNECEQHLMDIENTGQRYEMILDAMNDGVLLAEPDSKNFIFANKKISQMLGYDRKELTSLGVEDIHPKEVLRFVVEQFENLKIGKYALAKDIPVKRRDGSVFYADINSSKIKLSSKDYLIGVFRDSTGRKRAEEALNRAYAELDVKVQKRTAELKKANEILRENEERFCAIFEFALDGLFVIDMKGRYKNVNNAVCRMLGYTREELLSSDVRLLFFPEEAEDALQNHSKIWAEGGSLHDLRLRNKDGAEVYVDININPLHIGGESVALGIVRDITARKRLEGEILKTHKFEFLGVLAGRIGHDFNNLLTGIIGNLSLVEQRVCQDENTYKRFIEIEKAAIQAKELAQQLLTFSREGKPIKETIPIGPLIQESTCSALRGSNVRCTFSIPDDLWHVDADNGQLSQVINNLTINADQAMPEGGVLRLKAENYTVTEKDNLPLLDGRYVKVTIEDQGVGIPKELLSKIFDPYFTTKQKGSGLGLASAYSVVNKHGGYTEVSSQVGVGTTFHLYLPASEKDTVVEKKAAEEVPSLAEGRVLVMDDEVIVRDVAYAILTSLGYKVKTATDGNETIRLYKEATEKGAPFDVVIMDLTVPGGMGGEEAVKRLLELDPSAKVVVSSGYSNSPVMADFKKYGFNNVIAKPYRMNELGMKVHKVISEN